MLARKLIKTFSLLSYEERVAIGAVERPTYAYCIFQAARLASLLNYRKISILELRLIPLFQVFLDVVAGCELPICADCRVG